MKLKKGHVGDVCALGIHIQDMDRKNPRDNTLISTCFFTLYCQTNYYATFNYRRKFSESFSYNKMPKRGQKRFECALINF